MEKPTAAWMERARRPLAALAAAVDWIGLDLQLAVLHETAEARGVDFLTATVNFFSYFTILSNILAAAVLTASALRRDLPFLEFLRRPGTATAVAVYMTVTGLVYLTILRTLWNPQGLAWVADVILHYVMPVATVAYWLVFVPKDGLRARAVPAWLIFPLAYGAYALLRGAVTGFYPYPFVNAADLGYPAVVGNVVLLTIGFAALGLVAVGVGRAVEGPASPARPGSKPASGGST